MVKSSRVLLMRVSVEPDLIRKVVFNVEQKVIRSNVLLPFIEASYRDEYTEYSRKNLRCSDAGAAADEGDKCEREIYYDFTISDKKSLLTSGSLALFDDGRLHEADIRRRLRLVLRSPERELSDPETGARGKIDNMVDARKFTLPVEVYSEGGHFNPPEGDPVLEIKSVNEFAFQEMARAGKINQSYYDQIQYYLLLSGAAWAIVLIKNRNSSGDEKGSLPYLEYIVMPDPDRQSQIRAGLKTILDCVKDKILPARPFLRSSTKCSYCRYKYTCWPVEERAIVAVEKELAGEAPDKEMLEAAMKVYNATAKVIDEAENVRAQAKAIIERYFKATGAEDLLVDNIKALYSKVDRSAFDKLKLISEIGLEKYASVSEPVRKLLEKAVADRLIDAKVIEDATIPGKTSYTLRVSEIKSEISEREKAKVPEKEKVIENKKTKRARPESNKKNKPGSKTRAPKA